MAARSDELEAFKTDVDLREVAASLGYERNHKRSSRGSEVMDNAAGDRVLIAVAPDGHWIYCSVRDPGDAGSVIDFWQRRQGGNLGDVRKALRPFLDGGAPPPLPRRSAPMPKLEPIERDILAVRARYECAQPIDGYHPYLVERRKIPAALLAQEAFASRTRTDERGNAVFVHFNRSGVCGFELKNNRFTGFARGGTKGLWASVPADTDRDLVIAETAIDALSYAALSGHHRRRFVSTAGQLNNDQPGLIQSAIEKMPQGGRVVMALDNDEGGDELAARITDLYAAAKRIDLALVDDRPQIRGTDWNDALIASTPPLPSSDGPGIV